MTRSQLKIPAVHLPMIFLVSFQISSLKTVYCDDMQGRRERQKHKRRKRWWCHMASVNSFRYNIAQVFEKHFLSLQCVEIAQLKVFNRITLSHMVLFKFSWAMCPDNEHTGLANLCNDGRLLHSNHDDSDINMISMCVVAAHSLSNIAVMLSSWTLVHILRKRNETREILWRKMTTCTLL